jgi:hypothetical protein
MRSDVAFAYVRDLLERITGVRPEADGDGDLAVTFEGGSFFVRIVGSADSWVQVFSVAVADLEPTPDLMIHINDINRELRFARAFHVGSQLLFESEIWADDVNPSNFHHACSNVARAADYFAPHVRERFGGRPLFEELKTDDYQSSSGFTAGPYL